MTPGSTLRRFAQRAAEASAAAVEKCDLCSEAILELHRHLLEIETRQAVCVCQACAILFAQPAASVGKYRLIPNRCVYLRNFSMTDAEWESLRVPVGICFLVPRRDAAEPTAFYPSPIGATEAVVDPSTWAALRQRYAVLASIEPDVEALLVNRARGARDSFVVPIDTCFSLVGLIRMRWRGLSGGSDVWTGISQFFTTLQRQSRETRTENDAVCQSATI